MKTNLARWAVFLAGAALVWFALARSGDPPAARLLEHRFLAMGTAAVVKAEWPADRAALFAPCMEELEAAVRRVEKRMSRFDPESDVSRFNAAAPGEMVAVDPLTWMALTESMRVYALSGGAFDPTVLPLLRLYDWGNREAGRFPDDAAIAAARAMVGMDKIVWEREGMRLGKRVAGVELDLGGVAKGLGVDLAAGCLTAHGVRNAVIDIGGEQRVLGRALAGGEDVRHELLGGGGEKKETGANGDGAGLSREKGGDPVAAPVDAAASGSTPANAIPTADVVAPAGEPERAGETAAAQAADKTPRRPWVTGIRSPRAPDGPVAQVLRIHRDCAVATSGDYEQYFLWQGRRYSHILDPRSGRPLSGGVVSATVVLPGACMTADALATAASVLGVDGARELLAAFPAAEAWLIRADGSLVHIPAAASRTPVAPEGKTATDVTAAPSSQSR